MAGARILTVPTLDSPLVRKLNNEVYYTFRAIPGGTEAAVG